MTTFVVGATGATGRLLVQQLLERGHPVKAVVRSADKIPKVIRNHPSLSIIEASILELTDDEMAKYMKDCSAVASCLGHTMSFKGVFGHPRRLVTDATRRLCDAIKADPSDQPRKFVLMNTAGNRNRDLDEPVSFAQRCVVGLLRGCVPPHADNEDAADFLRTKIGHNHTAIEWVAVRPDSLMDRDTVTPYALHASPIRSAIFDPGKTSRINVAHFITELIADPVLWNKWKGQMPVIYNRTS